MSMERRAYSFSATEKMIKTRVLTKNDYRMEIEEAFNHFKITDKVVCFYNGSDWNVILLEDMLAYPTLYFDFWSAKDNVTYTNTLIVCPITLRSMIYKGIINIIDIVSDRLYLHNQDTGDSFFMEQPYTGHVDEKGKKKKIKSHVKRHEVKILILKDVYTFILDPKFVVINKKHRSIIDEAYYINSYTYDGKTIGTSYHPKSIVYIVQYYSKKINNYRYSAIVGRDISKTDVTGYHYKGSGVWDFINKHKAEFLEKRAYIYPIMWCMVEKLYPDIQLITTK